jgi:DNA repair exonuclease SbcCD ATPase subunit
MTTETLTPKGKNALDEFTGREAAIAELREKYKGLTLAKDGEEALRKARKELVSMRGQLKSRKETLNEDALAWQRKVNAEWKRMTAVVEEIENPIDRQIKEFEASEQRRLEAKAEAARQERIAADKAKLEVEMAERRKAQEDEQARLAEQAKQLEAQRKEMESQQAELAQAKADEAERSAKAKRAKEAAEAVERHRVLRQRLEEERKERLAATAPVREKLSKFAASLFKYKRPILGGDEKAEKVLCWAESIMQKMKDIIESWDGGDFTPPSI